MPSVVLLTLVTTTLWVSALDSWTYLFLIQTRKPIFYRITKFALTCVLTCCSCFLASATFRSFKQTHKTYKLVRWFMNPLGNGLIHRSAKFTLDCKMVVMTSCYIMSHTHILSYSNVSQCSTTINMFNCNSYLLNLSR